MQQLSSEWFAARVGNVTASRIADVMATLKSGGEAATRKNYRAQLAAERLTGNKADSYSNSAMQWGVETEPLARAAYEIARGVFVDEVGYISHPTIERAGASPDGFVGDGLIEIKCPNTATHIDYMIAGVVPAEYQLQMLWQMECTGRSWCDFVSYDPRMPEELRLFVVRYERDDARLDAIREAVIVFLKEVDDLVTKLEKIKGAKK